MRSSRKDVRYPDTPLWNDASLARLKGGQPAMRVRRHDLDRGPRVRSRRLGSAGGVSKPSSRFKLRHALDAGRHRQQLLHPTPTGTSLIDCRCWVRSPALLSAVPLRAAHGAVDPARARRRKVFVRRKA